MLRFVKNEIESIKMCSDCYSKANESLTFFVDVCEVPHLLIWAKLKPYPYWPAKLMSIDGSTVNVRFFGEHNNASLLAEHCYTYSKENPNAKESKNKKNELQLAIEVMNHLFIPNSIMDFRSNSICFFLTGK